MSVKITRASKKIEDRYGGMKMFWVTRPTKEKRELYQSEKMRAWKMIQDKIECIRCGCNDIRFLEINHINGGGGKEAKIRRFGIVKSILLHERDTDDLELLCRPCNHIHYLELKFGEKIPLKVVFNNVLQQNYSNVSEVMRNE